MKVVWLQERTILPNYKRVPFVASRSSTASSNLGLDCASNTTLLTNVSPFNSQVALITEKKSSSNGNQKPIHHYAENLRNNHKNTLTKSQIYNPLVKGLDTEYKQLDPLLKDHQSSENRNIMESQTTKDKVSFQFGRGPTHKISISTKYATQVCNWFFLYENYVEKTIYLIFKTAF